MNSSSSQNILIQCTTSARTERGVNHICPSKLSKHELEDLYFRLLQNNMELKKTINKQEEKIKVMSTKLQRVSTAQKAERAKEKKDCCPATKAVVKEQRDSIVELKKANEHLTERIRQLNMRLCSTKQFLKRPSLAGTRCSKCLMTPIPGSCKNISTSALNLRTSNGNIKTNSVSCQCLDKDPKIIMIEIETGMSDHTTDSKSKKYVEDKSGDKKKQLDLQDNCYRPAYHPVEIKSTEQIYNEIGEKRRDSKAAAQRKTSTGVNDKENRAADRVASRVAVGCGQGVKLSDVETKGRPGRKGAKSSRSAEDRSSKREKKSASQETQYRDMSQRWCDDNRCRTLMEELKQTIADLQEEHREYSSRISRLEEEVVELHGDKLRLASDSAARALSGERRERAARDAAARLRDALAHTGDLETQLAIEKSKVAELETQVKAASITSQVAKTIEGHLSKKIDEEGAIRDTSPEQSKAEKRESLEDPLDTDSRNDTNIMTPDIAILEYNLSESNIQTTTGVQKEKSLKNEDSHNKYQIPGPQPVSSHKDSIVTTRRASNLSTGSKRSSRSQKKEKRDSLKSYVKVLTADDSLNFVFKNNTVVPVDNDQNKTNDSQPRDKNIKSGDEAIETEEEKYFLDDLDTLQTQNRANLMASDEAKHKQDLDNSNNVGTIEKLAVDANKMTEENKTGLYQYIDTIPTRVKLTKNDNDKTEEKVPDFFDDIDSLHSRGTKIDSVKSDFQSADVKSEADFDIDTREILPQCLPDAGNKTDTTMPSPASLYMPPTLPETTASEQTSNHLDICEQLTHVCTCPQATRRDVAIFRSCSGTLRFKTTSASSNKFRRCKCCRKPAKMITCEIQAESDDEACQEMQADRETNQKPQNFSIQSQALMHGQQAKTGQKVEASTYIDEQRTPETHVQSPQRPFRPAQRIAHDSNLVYDYQPPVPSARARDNVIDNVSLSQMSHRDRKSQDSQKVDASSSISRRDRKSQDERINDTFKSRMSLRDRRSQEDQIKDAFQPRTSLRNQRYQDDEIIDSSQPRTYCRERRLQEDQIEDASRPRTSRKDSRLQEDQIQGASQHLTSRRERRLQEDQIEDASQPLTFRRDRRSQEDQIEDASQPRKCRRNRRQQEEQIEDASQIRPFLRNRRSQDVEIDNASQPRTSRPERMSDDNQKRKLQTDPMFSSQACDGGMNEQVFQIDQSQVPHQGKMNQIDQSILAYGHSKEEPQKDSTLLQFEPRSAASDEPRTYVITESAEVVKCSKGTSSENTDYDISSMTTEKPSSSQSAAPAPPLSPGERKSSSYTDSCTMTYDNASLSEGELPAQAGARKTCGTETQTKDKPPDANPSDGGGGGTSGKMEEALQAIGEELARCRRLLLHSQRTRESQQSREGKDAATMAELSPSGPIALRRSDGKPRIGDAFTPKCIFTLHIGTIVLSDEAVINSRDRTLVLTWKFYDQNVAMTRMRAGRVVHFDFSTEYDVRLTDDFLDYLKQEEMSICICEVNKPEEPIAHCSLPLRDALLHTNRRADMSLALTAGPRMRRGRARLVADALDARDEMGVLDLWCMLRAEARLLPHINRAIAKSASIVAGGSGTRSRSMSVQPAAGGPIMAQINEDDQDECRLSTDLDLIPSTRRTIRYSEDGSVLPGTGARPHDGIETIRSVPKQERGSIAYPRESTTDSWRGSSRPAVPATLSAAPGPDIDPKFHEFYPIRGQVSFEEHSSATTSGIIINEVPANIKTTVEMKTALEKTRNFENLVKKPDDVMNSSSSMSLRSWLGRRGVTKDKQRLSLSDYAKTTLVLDGAGTGKYKSCGSAPVHDETPKSSLARDDSEVTIHSKKYENNDKLLVTKKALDAFKRVKIRRKQDSLPFQTEPSKGQSVDITVVWLALNEECEAMLDPGIQRLYVAYSFLGRDGAELETPISLPKPKQYQDKCFFDFKQTFQLTDSDVPRLGRLALCRSPAKCPPSPRDCVVFTVVSEPVEDPLAIHDCEDIGYAHLYMGDLLAFGVDSDSYTEVLPVLSARGDGPVCGVLAIK